MAQSLILISSDNTTDGHQQHLDVQHEIITACVLLIIIYKKCTETVTLYFDMWPSISILSSTEKSNRVYSSTPKCLLVICTDLTAVWAEAWVVCAGQDKTPGGTWAGGHGTAGLSLDTDQEGSMTPVSEK